MLRSVERHQVSAILSTPSVVHTATSALCTLQRVVQRLSTLDSRLSTDDLSTGSVKQNVDDDDGDDDYDITLLVLTVCTDLCT